MGMEDWNLTLANRINSSDKWNGFISAFTKGERGIGKSGYDLKNMALAYYKNPRENLSETRAWNKALDSLIFTPEQLSSKVSYNIEHEIIDLAWCIDDASVHFSSYIFFINVYQAALLNATFDTIRTVVRALLLNAPTKARLLKVLKNYDDYEITLYRMNGDYQRKAVAIKWYSLPDGKRKYRKEFEDYFSCHLPNWVYDKYMIMRKNYLKEINDEIVFLRNKLQQKKDKSVKSLDVSSL